MPQPVSHGVDMSMAWQRAKPRLLAAAQRQLARCLSSESSDEDQKEDCHSPRHPTLVTPSSGWAALTSTQPACHATAATQTGTPGNLTAHVDCHRTNPPAPPQPWSRQYTQPSSSHCCVESSSGKTCGLQQFLAPSTGAPLQSRLTDAPLQSRLTDSPTQSCHPPPSWPSALCTPLQACMCMQRVCVSGAHTPAALPCMPPATQQPCATTEDSRPCAQPARLHTAADSKLRHAKAALQHHVQKAQAFCPYARLSKPRSRQLRLQARSPKHAPNQIAAAQAPSLAQQQAHRRPDGTDARRCSLSEAVLFQPHSEPGTPVLEKMAKRWIRESLASSPDSVDSPHSSLAPLRSQCCGSVTKTCSAGPTDTSQWHLEASGARHQHLPTGPSSCSSGDVDTAPHDFDTAGWSAPHWHRELARELRGLLDRTPRQGCSFWAQPDDSQRRLGRPCGSRGERGSAPQPGATPQPRAAWQQAYSAGPSVLEQGLRGLRVSGGSGHHLSPGVEAPSAAESSCVAAGRSGSGGTVVDAVDAALAALRQRTAEVCSHPSSQRPAHCTTAVSILLAVGPFGSSWRLLCAQVAVALCADAAERVLGHLTPVSGLTC